MIMLQAWGLGLRSSSFDPTRRTLDFAFSYDPTRRATTPQDDPAGRFIEP